MRYSKQRDVILSIIQTSNQHLTADIIFKKVQKEINNISLGTIYRNLTQLVKEGYIIQINGFDNRTYYDKTLTDHGHLFCEKCKKVVDVNYESIKDLKSNILNNDQFEIKKYNISIVGICSKCQSKERGN